MLFNYKKYIYKKFINQIMFPLQLARQKQKNKIRRGINCERRILACVCKVVISKQSQSRVKISSARIGGCVQYRLPQCRSACGPGY